MPRTTFQSLGGLFTSALRRYAARIAVITPSGARITYRELDEQSTRLANALAARGVGAGSVVALLLRNGVEFVIADLAVMKLGAAKVPLNSLLAPSNVGFMLRHSHAVALVMHTSLAHLLPSLAEIPDVANKIAVADGEQRPPSFDDWQEFLAAASLEPVVSHAGPETVGLIIYTGGTTGEPKGVVHGQSGLAQNILSQVIMSEITSDERMLITTPLPHAAHLLLQAGLLRGAMIWITEGFNPAQTLELIRSERLTYCFLVPTMIYRLLDQMEQQGGADVSSLRTVLYGASPISRPKLVSALEKFGPIFLQIYGQTEAPNFITALSKSDHLIPELQLSCGQPVLATQVRISSPEGEELRLGEIGEVQVRSVYTLAAYHADPVNSAAAYCGEWMRTGDLGYQNESGHVFLVDRLKDMVISGGMNVYSSEVEQVIQTFPGVGQVVVIGIPDPQWGEVVAAFVVPNATSVDIEPILNHCRQQLARYKVPKIVNLVKQIPLTNYGKPDKKALRAQFWSAEGRSIS
jgi:fatty-acyl-CoA synthase